MFFLCSAKFKLSSVAREGQVPRKSTCGDMILMGAQQTRKSIKYGACNGKRTVKLARKFYVWSSCCLWGYAPINRSYSGLHICMTDCFDETS